MGEGEILNSTIDLPQASSTNRFSNFNPDRCVSTPQINVTGFIDDTFHNNRGTQLEERIRTRSNKDSNSIDAKLREDFTQIKIAVIEWGEIACSSALTVDVINKKHNALCAQIEHKILEVLMKRGDYGLVGELGSLKDRLNLIRKEAKQLASSRPLHEGIVPLSDARPGERSIMELFTRSYHAENVFFDDPESEQQRPDSRGVRNMDASGINPAGSKSVMAREQRIMDDSSSTRLTASWVLYSNDASSQRSVEIDLSQSLTEIIASVHGVKKNPQLGINVISNHTDAWMHAMKSRQGNYEEQLKRMQDNLVTLSITMQGAESFYKELQGDVEALKSNSSEVWERLKTDERRMDKLDRSVSLIEERVKENLERVNEWFNDITARPSPEIPREIVNSLQEVINDSSPGVAVDRMRDEIIELREALRTSRYATEGLRGLVVNLSDQVSSNPPTQIIRDESLTYRDEQERMRDREKRNRT